MFILINGLENVYNLICYNVDHNLAVKENVFSRNGFFYNTLFRGYILAFFVTSFGFLEHTFSVFDVFRSCVPKEFVRSFDC